MSNKMWSCFSENRRHCGGWIWQSYNLPKWFGQSEIVSLFKIYSMRLKTTCLAEMKHPTEKPFFHTNFSIWPRSVTLIFDLSEQMFETAHLLMIKNNCQITLKFTSKCRAYALDKARWKSVWREARQVTSKQYPLCPWAGDNKLCFWNTNAAKMSFVFF